MIAALAREAVALGFCVSFAGIVTFPRADTVRDAARQLFEPAQQPQVLGVAPARRACPQGVELEAPPQPEAIRAIQAHSIGVVGLFVFGFDQDTPQTLVDTWEFVRDSELDSMSMTILTPYPGTPFRAQLVAENRLMEKPWRYYDTAHVTCYPRLMTVEELETSYDWFCRQVYSPLNMARRGWRTLRRHPVSRMPRKVFGSISTEYGYRRTFSWRHVDSGRLLSAWSANG